MDLEREQLVEIAVSVSAVGLFVVVLVLIGLEYTDADNFAPEGGLVLVGAVAGFVLVMALVGVGLAYYLNRPAE